MSSQLSELRDSVSGVSLDEEMANLIKYQQAYTAAAKLITMSDEMLQTLLQTVIREGTKIMRTTLTTMNQKMLII